MSVQIGKALLTCQAGAHEAGHRSGLCVSLVDVKGSQHWGSLLNYGHRSCCITAWTWGCLQHFGEMGCIGALIMEEKKKMMSLARLVGQEKAP